MQTHTHAPHARTGQSCPIDRAQTNVCMKTGQLFLNPQKFGVVDLVRQPACHVHAVPKLYPSCAREQFFCRNSSTGILLQEFFCRNSSAFFLQDLQDSRAIVERFSYDFDNKHGTYKVHVKPEQPETEDPGVQNTLCTYPAQVWSAHWESGTS